jgi:hypothetical protein
VTRLLDVRVHQRVEYSPIRFVSEPADHLARRPLRGMCLRIGVERRCLGRIDAACKQRFELRIDAAGPQSPFQERIEAERR